MALTTRVNGRTPASQINASWFNDFNNLFNEVMADQQVAFLANVSARSRGGSPSALTAAVVSGSGLSIGAYSYRVTFLSVDGETVTGAATNVTTTSGNQKVNLSNIPIGPAGTVARHVYRTTAGGSTYWHLALFNDNTTTTFVDTITDLSITGGAQPPAKSTFGGCLMVKNGSNVVKGTIYSDGSFSFDGGLITSDGSGNINVNGNHVPFLVSTVGTVGRQIFVGLTTPTGANEGDIWIKA